MKKTLLLALLAFALYSCGGNAAKQDKPKDAETDKQQEKQLFDKVINLHNEVMNYEQMIMENKMQLDSLAKVNAAVKDSAVLLSKNLEAADNAMGDWMHKFEPEYSNKPHDEVIKYMTEQEASITRVDSITKAAIKASWQFLSKHKK